MALSLVVVAGAAEAKKTVELQIVPAMTDEEANGKTELTYHVFLKPQGDAEVGAAQFTLTAPEGTKFKSVEFNTEYVYDDSSETPVVGSANGIFAKGAITSGPNSLDFGGELKDSGSTFVAILAGTIRGERMLTAGNSGKWLYEVTLTVPEFDGNTNYTIDVKDATAGYNGDSNETGKVSEVTVKHIVNVSSKGYGGMLGDVNGDGKVNIIDVGMLYSYVLGVNKNLTAQQLANANVNGDKVVNIIDVGRLYAFVLGTNKNPLG